MAQNYTRFVSRHNLYHRMQHPAGTVILGLLLQNTMLEVDCVWSLLRIQPEFDDATRVG